MHTNVYAGAPYWACIMSRLLGCLLQQPERENLQLWTEPVWFASMCHVPAWAVVHFVWCWNQDHLFWIFQASLGGRETEPAHQHQDFQIQSWGPYVIKAKWCLGRVSSTFSLPFATTSILFTPLFCPVSWLGSWGSHYWYSVLCDSKE